MRTDFYLRKHLQKEFILGPINLPVFNFLTEDINKNMEAEKLGIILHPLLSINTIYNILADYRGKMIGCAFMIDRAISSENLFSFFIKPAYVATCAQYLDKANSENEK